jgi:CheY-like chemotaxis protein
MVESRRKRILIVEDEPLVAKLLEDFVVELGFDVVGPALRLEAAVELVDSETVDAAILDVNLGNCRSYPLAERLMAANIPFAFATGYGAHGFDTPEHVPLIRKPFERDSIGAVLSDLLARPSE